MNGEEEIIVGELAEGLLETGVDPVAVLGKCAESKLHQGRTRLLTKEEIIRVQELLLARLQNEILQK